MKRNLAPALFMLSLCAVLGGAREAGAQKVDATLPAIADSTLAAIEVLAPEPSPVTVVTQPPLRGGPVIAEPSPILLRDAHPIPEMLAGSAALPVAADWRMPASRTLIIGGTAAAIIGLAAVGGDAGAVIALSGTAVALYGLYLHYNR